MKVFDFAIVGAGPAGSMLAGQLSAAGYDVVLLEAQNEMKRKVCGEYLCPKGVELLQNENMDQHILADFMPIKGMNIFTPSGCKVQAFFPHIKNVNPHGRAVRRDEFDQRLLEYALGKGAQLQKGYTVNNLKYENGQWLITNTENMSIKSRVLIGADGRRSIVSRFFKSSQPIEEKRVALHVLLSAKSINSRQGEMHLFSDGSYIGIDPIDNHQVNLSLVCPAHKIKEFGSMVNVLNHYLQSSRDLYLRFQSLPSDIKVSAVSPITHKVGQIAGHNWALVGDAAGFIDPLTGEGMYNALWSALRLAQIIKNNNHMLNFAPALKEYETDHQEHFYQKTRLNTLFQWIIRRPLWVECIARFLLAKPHRADVFVGIIGNIFTPLQGLYHLLFKPYFQGVQDAEIQ